MASNQEKPIILMQAESDGRRIVIFSGSAPRSLEGKLFILEKLGLGTGVEIEFVEAAIIKPLPSGDSDDVKVRKGPSAVHQVYGADFSDVSDWSCVGTGC